MQRPVARDKQQRILKQKCEARTARVTSKRVCERGSAKAQTTSASANANAQQHKANEAISNAETGKQKQAHASANTDLNAKDSRVVT